MTGAPAFVELLQHPIDVATSRPTEMLLLFLLPFVRQDVAITTGSLLIVEHRLPLGLALASLYAGIVASDFLLFGVGRAARRSARARRLLLSPRAERIGPWLRQHLAAAMIVARIVPGVILPVYVACGLAGVRSFVFAPITMLTAAVYLPVLLWLVIRFGEGVLSRAGYWAWIAAILLLIATDGWMRDPPWGMLLRVGRSGLCGLFVRARPPGRDAGSKPPGHAVAAWPRLPDRADETHSAKAFISAAGSPVDTPRPPTRQHYLADPRQSADRDGRALGRVETIHLDMVSGDERRWLARNATLTRRRGADAAEDGGCALALAGQAGLTFPLVAKPDIGWQGYGVRLVGSESDLLAYVAAFPEGAALMLQERVAWEGEAGVFYVRLPGAETGRVVGLTFRYFPHVVGDGERSVRDLILVDQRASWKAGAHLGLQKHGGLSAEVLERVPQAGEVVRLSFIGSVRVGGLYRDARKHITPALSARFDAISRSMPEFDYGRYDVRFASIERLRAGEDFRIIEINGAGGESISVWDPEMPLRAVYGRLFEHQRLLFEIGARNRARGWKPAGPVAVLRAAWRQSGLVDRYPPSS